MQQEEKCPVCKAPWPGDKFVGEKAITAKDQNPQNRQRSTNHNRTQSGVGSSTQMSADATGEEEEDSDENVG